MIRCKDISRLFTDFRDGALGFWTSGQYRLHLMMCPNCEMHVAKMEELATSLGNLAPDEKVPEHLESVFDTLRGE